MKKKVNKALQTDRLIKRVGDTKLYTDENKNKVF